MYCRIENENEKPQEVLKLYKSYNISWYNTTFISGIYKYNKPNITY